MLLPRGVNFIGRPRLACGTSIHARLLIDAMLRGGIDVVVYDVEGELEDRRHDDVPAYRTVGALNELPYDVTFVFDIPLALIKLIDVAAAVLPGHHLVSNLSWEFERIPQEWIPAFRKIHTWCAPSRFLQDTLRRSLGIEPPHLPVTPLTDELVAGAVAPEGFATQDRAFVFYLNFDLLSGIQRKNPQFAIAAFLEAFGTREDVRLVIKAWQSGASQLAQEYVNALMRNHSNITVVTESFEYTQNLALMKTCQAYLSPHHAEGLGLGLLEAMSFGMPVVATNYSACTDYLDDTCGVPLPYTPIPVSGEPTTDIHSCWAMPDFPAMVLGMRRLVADPQWYQSVSAGARKRYEQRRAEFLGLQWATEMLEPNRPFRPENAVV